ncbi:LysR-family transcriptional regulator [plant metagenome]|uniref:LysR-family transcriptional regulator n=2 Tax=plant metagenome TaxID=1297885 RepID=A0A484PKV6_9ZZZZ
MRRAAGRADVGGKVGAFQPPAPTSAMYTLKQMEAFYWSAVLGSFSASSQKLHTTQSAIAKRVAELESFAGGPLLNRQTRSLTLTAQGRKLFDLAGEMLELNTRIALRMGDAHTLAGTVRLGATELIGLTWLATLIDQSTRRYPRLQLLPEIDGGMTLYKRLAEDSLDVALMPGPFWSYEYDCVPLASIRNVWMASPRLGIDTSQVLSPFDLVQHPVITQPTNSALTHLYDAWFAEQGMGVKRVLTCNSLGLVAQLTMLGLGISYLPPSYFAPLTSRGDLVQLNVAPDLPRVHYYAVYKKTVMSPLVAKVIEMAQEVCNFEGGGSFIGPAQAHAG